MSSKSADGSGAASWGGGGLTGLNALQRLQVDGENFSLWRFRLQATLAREWHVVEKAGEAEQQAQAAQLPSSGKKAAPASGSGGQPGDDKKMSAEDVAHTHRAYSVLIATLPDQLVYLVMPPTVAAGDAAAVWRALRTHFERKTMASKAHTRKMLHQSKMQEGERVDTYWGRKNGFADQLRAAGETVSDGELLYAVQDGLPSSWSGLKLALAVQDSLTMETLRTCLRDHEEKIKYELLQLQEEEEEEIAHYAQQRQGGRAGGRGGSGRGGRGGGGGGGARHDMPNGGAGSTSRGRDSSGRSSDSSDESTYRCRLCRVVGHWESFCPRRRGNGSACFRCGSEAHQMRDCRGGGKDASESAVMAVEMFDPENDLEC